MATDGAGATVQANDRDVVSAPSETLATTVYTPAVVMVPVIQPLAAARFRPGGSPVMLNVIESPLLSLAFNCITIESPAVLVWDAGVLNVGATFASRIVQVNVCDADCAPLLAETVTLKPPGTEGVPLMRPVLEFTERPGGRDAAAKRSALLLASLACSCNCTG